MEGLGYTAQAVLEHKAVKSLVIVEAPDAVIDWPEKGVHSEENRGVISSVARQADQLVNERLQGRISRRLKVVDQRSVQAGASLQTLPEGSAHVWPVSTVRGAATSRQLLTLM